MRIKNLPSIESMDGSQDALVIEQTDGSEDKSRKVSPAQIKQYVLGEVDEVPTEDSDNLVKSGGIFSTMAVPKYDSANRREYYEGGSAFSGNIDSTPTAGSNNAVASGGTKSYVDNLTNFLGFTHFVQIPFTTSVLDSIKAAFEDTTIPVDLFGITLGIVRGGAGSQRVIFIAQNQRLSTTQTRYAAIYFGAYTAPRFLQKQDGTDWTDVAL